jgi:tRNA (guanosine-2'-O-)-methyltransferase
MLTTLLATVVRDNGIKIQPPNRKHREGVRQKAKIARNSRSTTVVCVLENPKNAMNIASVIRNVNALGVSRLYVVSTTFCTKEQFHSHSMTEHSASANLWTYIHVFASTQACMEYLEKANFVSFMTTPNPERSETKSMESTACSKQQVSNLQDVEWHRFRKVALWFGNEVKGLTDYALSHCHRWLCIPAGGIVESLNLASCSAIVLFTVTSERKRTHPKKRK